MVNHGTAHLSTMPPRPAQRDTYQDLLRLVRVAAKPAILVAFACVIMMSVSEKLGDNGLAVDGKQVAAQVRVLVTA